MKIILITLIVAIFFSCNSFANDKPSKPEVMATIDLALSYGQKCSANWQTGENSNYYKGACKKYWDNYKKLPAHVEAIKNGSISLNKYELQNYNAYLNAIETSAIKIKSYKQ